MKTTGLGDVNRYSPHIGQSHSVDRSMHLCVLSIEVEMHARHVWKAISLGVGVVCDFSHLAMKEIFAKTHPLATDTTIVAVIDRFAGSILP